MLISRVFLLVLFSFPIFFYKRDACVLPSFVLLAFSSIFIAAQGDQSQ